MLLNRCCSHEWSAAAVPRCGSGSFDDVWIHGGALQQFQRCWPHRTQPGDAAHRCALRAEQQQVARRALSTVHPRSCSTVSDTVANSCTALAEPHGSAFVCACAAAELQRAAEYFLPSSSEDEASDADEPEPSPAVGLQGADGGHDDRADRHKRKKCAIVISTLLHISSAQT